MRPAAAGHLDLQAPRDLLYQAAKADTPSATSRPSKFGDSMTASGPTTGDRLDWLFVMPGKPGSGWILEAICREIGSRQPGSWQIVHQLKRLPPARNYFFAHYSTYEFLAQRNPHIFDSATLVWYTHPRDIRVSIDDQLAAFNRAHRVVFTCSQHERAWTRIGLKPGRSCVVLGGADPALFRAHARGTGVVGLSSAFYERKRPRALLDLVERMPHRRFVLVGRNWSAFEQFDRLLAAPNFSYVEATYDGYPAIYDRFDVFLSLSTMEGGPIPLIETMMANAVPVASRTGFATDLITHGENGFLFDIDAAPDEIAELVEQAFALEADIRPTVIDHSWDNFAAAIVRHAESFYESPDPAFR
ncbi:glycosyltransferase family 4 protein [Methylobacterium oryzihabitans]|uniref:Glycosyltransferase n=1 Tax=Methylobacterium oryzihabitans TaxID=2499852 RepID=A0A3S2VF66_9HYPH|nr:glycosyltransferase family 4 protein [Methylobacterium oryzihabitans]RVU21632.1 glycosyltransferase [Methylobacterium oryzihabitans]